MKSNKKEKSELEIKKELISNDLSKLLGALIIILLIAGIFGYLGYIYSKDNNISISHGIIFGTLFPFGVGLLELYNCNSFLCFILYTVVYIIIASFVPTFVGGIILFLIIGIFIVKFIDIEQKDRTEEINKIIEKNNKDTNNYNTNEKGVYDKSKGYITPYEPITMDEEVLTEDEAIEDEIDEDSENRYIDDEEEFECEMCFKKISEEEYELYDCMCEECFMNVHTDSNGNFHDEELF